MKKVKKRVILDHEEIAEKLQNFDIDSDQMDDFFDQLNDNDISLINEKDSSDTRRETESRINIMPLQVLK